MIGDPVLRGRALAAFFLALEPRLFAELAEAGVHARDAEEPSPEPNREEWRCFALYACVRGLVAAGGFNRETAAAIEAFHDHVLGAWEGEAPGTAPTGDRRALVSERYAEYGEIGRTHGTADSDVNARLGEAAARHIAGDERARESVSRIVGALHESLFEGAAEMVRRGT